MTDDKLIEELAKKSTKLVLLQEFVDLGFPTGAPLTFINNQFVVILENQMLPIVYQGAPVWMNNKVYDKRETFKWVDTV